MENGNSSGVVYKKSTRRAVSDVGSFATTRHLVLPLDRTCNIIFSFINSSIKETNTLDDFEVMITSISPEVSAPRR